MMEDLLPSLFVEKSGHAKIDHLDKPIPSDHEVVVQVVACGICGTDRHIYHGKFPARYPVVIGHEFSGKIVSIGSKVQDLELGDLVSINPNIICGQCSLCREGFTHLCKKMIALGVDLNGGLSPYCLVPIAQIYKIDPLMDQLEASLAEPLSCILHGVDRLQVKAGTTAAVFGGGFIGQLMAQVLHLNGAVHVTVFEPNRNKRKIAEDLGFTAVDPTDEQGKRKLAALDGFDITVDCAGAGDVLQQCIEATRPGGKILLFAAYPSGKQVPIIPFDVFRKELQIIGSFTYPDTQLRAIRLLASKLLKLESIVTAISLEEVIPLLKGELDDKIVKGIVTFV
jgi:L-iditol 2-dehydrogenase